MKVFKRPVSNFFPVLKFLALPAVAAAIALSGCNGAANGNSLLNGSSTSSTSTTGSTTTTPAAKLTLLLSSTNVSATSAVNVTARVLDANNILLANKAITVATSSGAIANISNGGVTDASGLVTFSVTAPAGATSGSITVTVTADSIQQTATLNIMGNTAASIKLGAGNGVAELDTTRWEVPYNALVTDASGNPMPNATVQLTITPLNWYQGYFYVPTGATTWAQHVSSRIDCTSGGNCNPATISPSTTLVTDSTGFVTFNVIYAKSFAYWADVSVTATTSLIGGATTDTMQFTLTGQAAVYKDVTVAPPGQCSPFNSTPNQFGTQTIGSTTISTGC